MIICVKAPRRFHCTDTGPEPEQVANMPPQARIGDASQVPADGHGCPGCPHNAVGPAVSGSPNVMVNGRPAVRVGDSGIHAACCGQNSWMAKTGSRSVFINGQPAHRLGDMVAHCGGMGITIDGSPNVFIGDYCIKEQQENHRTHWINIQVNDLHGQPIPNHLVRLIFDGGGTMVATTNEQGNIQIKQLLPSIVKINPIPES